MEVKLRNITVELTGRYSNQIQELRILLERI